MERLMADILRTIGMAPREEQLPPANSVDDFFYTQRRAGDPYGFSPGVNPEHYRGTGSRPAFRRRAITPNEHTVDVDLWGEGNWTRGALMPDEQQARRAEDFLKRQYATGTENFWVTNRNSGNTRQNNIPRPGAMTGRGY